MTELRDAAVQRILRILDDTLLTSHAFDTSFNQEEKYLACFVFREHPDFRFIIEEGSAWADYKWLTRQSPGVEFVDESFEHESYNECLEQISSWVQRLLSEITPADTKPAQILEALKQSLDAKVEEIEDSEEPFGEKDAEMWKARLDEAFDRISELRDESSIQQRDIILLKSQIEELKKAVTVMPRKTWVRTVGNRTLVMIEKLTNSRAGQVIAEKVIKGLLGDGS